MKNKRLIPPNSNLCMYRKQILGLNSQNITIPVHPFFTLPKIIQFIAVRPYGTPKFEASIEDIDDSPDATPCVLTQSAEIMSALPMKQ